MRLRTPSGWIAALLSLIVVFASAAAARAPAAFHDTDGGWHEAWIGVSDLARMQTFFEEAAGWRVIRRGRLDREFAAYLAPQASGGRFVVMASADYPQGWVRLIELRGVDRRIIRRNAQAWDTGGVFSLMTRSRDIERNLVDAERLGWTAFNDPYDFSFGPLKLRNIVLRGPDGVNLAIYEWVDPKREDAPPAGAVSKAFNAMVMTADLDKARTFLIEGLGFSVIQEGAFRDAQPGPTNFALPLNYATEVSRNYAILIPAGGNDEAGRIELMQFEGFAGRSLDGRAALSGLGIVSLVFPVSNLDAVERRLELASIDIHGRTRRIDLPPFGVVRALTVSSPDGVLLTFIEQRKP